MYDLTLSLAAPLTNPIRVNAPMRYSQLIVSCSSPVATSIGMNGPSAIPASKPRETPPLVPNTKADSRMGMYIEWE
jgi:hypothetical protein